MEPISTQIDPTKLKARSAFVTGGASGIGLATARSWAASGAYVTIADIQPVEAGQQLVATIANANYVYCDVTSWESQAAAFKSAIEHSPFRTLDIVAIFAGTAAMPGNQVDHVLAAGEPSLQYDPSPPNIQNINVNLIGAYYTSWLALYYFRMPPSGPNTTGTDENISGTSASGLGPGPTRDKSLIFMASVGAYMDSPKASTYPASKFGVRGLFRSTRARTLDIGVRCNLLAPWFVDTPLIAPMKNAMASRGIDMGKRLEFVSIDSCVEAASLCAVDTRLHGRALGIQPEGTFDLKDDCEDGWAGDQMRHVMQRRREAGFDG